MMKIFQFCKRLKYWGWGIVLLFSVFQVSAHEIHLKSGKIIKTPSVQEEGDLVVYEKKGGLVSISKELVREILYSQPSQVSTTAKKASGPIAYYPFDGNADDRMNSDSQGVVYGARLVADRRERLKSAYRFDGVDDYIQVDTPVLPTPPFTVSFWINTYAANANAQYLLSYGGQSGSFPGFYCKAIGKQEILHGRSLWPKSGIQCGIDDSKQNFSIAVTKESLTVNEWHHVLVAWDGVADLNRVLLYVDGKFASVLLDPQTHRPSEHADVLRIGASADSVSTGLFKGILDEIRFYDRILSFAEIEQLSQFTPRKGEFWEFDEE